jgi:hypothetical protein
MSDDAERTASLMTPAKLAQFRPKPAASPAAYLDRMAADAGAAHVRRLTELREPIAAQAGSADYAPCAQGLRAVAAALDALDFSLLQQNKGLLARMTGKGRSAGMEFVNQYDAVGEAAQRLKAQVQQLAAQGRDGAGAAERALVEFEVEYRGIEKVIDQGARWLQDMRGQLKARQAEAGGDEAVLQKVREDAARCELLVARLKQLRAASSAAQQSHQLLQQCGQRRAALLQSLHQRVTADFGSWQARMGPVAAAAGDSGSPALSLEGPQEAQRVLKQHLLEAAADCEQLQAQERALAESVAALDAQLRAAM